MGLSKVFLFLGAGLLAVCLVLSITTLQVLRNALDENDLLQESAYELVGELNGCVRALNELAAPVIPVNQEEGEKTEEVSAKPETFWCRASGNYVGLYNGDGKLLRITEIPLDHLPASTRESLQKGISLSSWDEVFKLLRDLES